VDFYREHGVRAACAGHPLVDSVPEPFESQADRELALLPGSRAQEVRLLLPPMLDAFSLLRERGIADSCAVSRCPSLPDHLYSDANDTKGVHLEDSIAHALSGASAAVVCSGTATLETAMWGVPMVIAYRTSPVTFFLARMLVRGVKRIGMANIVVKGRDDIAKELIQKEVSPESIAEAVSPLLASTVQRETSLKGLASVRDALGSPGAAERAAALILSECIDGTA